KMIGKESGARSTSQATSADSVRPTARTPKPSSMGCRSGPEHDLRGLAGLEDAVGLLSLLEGHPMADHPLGVQPPGPDELEERAHVRPPLPPPAPHRQPPPHPP